LDYCPAAGVLQAAAFAAFPPTCGNMILLKYYFNLKISQLFCLPFFPLPALAISPVQPSF
jgi:hypothetical protein